MQRLCIKKALFCDSPLRNDNISIQDMHTHKPLRSVLLMQRFVSHIAFRETAQEKFCSGTKRFIVSYRCITKCHKALQNARVKQRTPVLSGFCICTADSEKVNGSFMLCTAFEERDMHRFRIFFETTPSCHAYMNYTCH